MKIDLSTLLLVVVAVIPGLFAQRSRNFLVPRSFTAKGASEELAELVAFGIATQGLLIFVAAFILLILGASSGHGHAYYIDRIDSWHFLSWCDSRRMEAALLCSTYVFITFLVSHLLGLVYGGLSESGGITALLLSRIGWLSRFGIRGVLGERPIIYELLDAQLNETGQEKTVFIEAEMKDGLGFYSGQLSQFAIVRDEETHRPVYLVEPWYRSGRDDPYGEVGDRRYSSGLCRRRMCFDQASVVALEGGSCFHGLRTVCIG